MGMAGFARSGMGGKGSAGVQKAASLTKDSAQRADVARGKDALANSPPHNAETATGATVDLPVVEPPRRARVIEPPDHVDLACTRPHAERQNAVDNVEAHDLGTVRNVDAKPKASLPKASPTLPQTGEGTSAR